MKQRDIEELRTGFDLVFDIDCSFFEYSRISAELIVELLKHHHSISSVSAKFSGNKGFHIAIPFEALPETIGEDETRMLFPEAARRIAFYIKEKIKKPLGSRIMQLHCTKNQAWPQYLLTQKKYLNSEKGKQLLKK